MSRAIAHVWTEGFLFHAWPVIYLWGRVLRPLVAVGTGLDHLMHRLSGRPFHLGLGAAVEQEIHTVVNEAEREGHLEPDAREMIERAIEMRQAEVSKIMTPRTDMVTIPVTATLEEARHFMIESAHSRVPVYRESRDDIVGILYVRDLLAQWGRETEPRALLERVMRKPFFVPETKRVPALLQEFQRHHVQIAIVLDEYGGVSGLVTIEDILEEIVGEIVDEYDEAPRETIQPVSEHVVEVDARVHIDELNERLGLSLPEDGDFDTLGGFVFSHLGRLPALGEHFEYAHVRFTMIAVGKRSIDRIQLELEQQAELRRSDRAAQ